MASELMTQNRWQHLIQDAISNGFFFETIFKFLKSFPGSVNGVTRSERNFQPPAALRRGHREIGLSPIT